MKIVSVEPTPSPNVMKLNLDESLEPGKSYNVSRENQEGAPDYLRKLVAIDGVTGVFQVLDFISLERHPKADWEAVLAAARAVLGETAPTKGTETGNLVTDTSEDASFGEVEVQIQQIKDIPVQVKIIKNGEETRFGLPERFKEAVMQAQKATTNLIFERKWVQQKPRYGDVQEVGTQVVEEISAAYDEERLKRLVELAFISDQEKEKQKQAISREEVLAAFREEDWKKRYAALEQFEPSLDDTDILDLALSDSNAAIRRLAVVYLGLLENKEVLPFLYRALKDASPIVRRTAGDTLSDLGYAEAIPAMCEALTDPNKLVRWRAARFLYEIGDETALPALRHAANDREFEVRLQARMALERIERGEEASGTVWQQMMRKIEEDRGNQ
ncbi:conserved virulence factor C family protein [Thermoactinomyces sp. CICC 10522]|uniref:conserved virulence factor C family protein n=1 Tax=Thermoactinomyces sp. CICC 10522 TaxID=2767427 RepID=UPI0018DD7472|nr:conserved virulence factor C family protein [Thermoactinomyces sp. CICC 10522]MBH8603523.1 conserved virulence factor C family protein [Thermoactinomyces sp. CICC 10522]